MKATVPAGRVGDHEIEHFEVSETQAMIHNLRHRNDGRGIEAGTYTRLVRYTEPQAYPLDEGKFDNGKGRAVVVMSDTPAELRDHLEPVRHAKGNVLINGLGLGCVLQGCMAKPEVEHVTVVDISEEVIALSHDYFKELYGDRLDIVQASAFEYKAPVGSRFGMVWHDIWDYIGDENLPEMYRLHRKYGSRCDWQGSWVRDQCEKLRDNSSSLLGMFGFPSDLEKIAGKLTEDMGILL